MTENDNGKKNISNHIFPTSANLLGICFVIISFIKLFKLGHQTIIDELVAIVIVFFLASCLLSYVSIRAESKSAYYERIADTIFLIGLTMLTLISIVITLQIVR